MNPSTHEMKRAEAALADSAVAIEKRSQRGRKPKQDARRLKFRVRLNGREFAKAQLYSELVANVVRATLAALPDDLPTAS